MVLSCNNLASKTRLVVKSSKFKSKSKSLPPEPKSKSKSRSQK